MRQDQELAVEGEESATIDGMTPEEMREWQRAFLALQGRGGGAATTGPLVRLLRSGNPIPPAIAFALARLLDERPYVWRLDAKGSARKVPGRDCRIVLKIGKNARWDRQQRSALNRQNKRRIGEGILRDIEAGLTTEQAIAKRMKAKTFGRSYLFECLAEAAPKGPAYLRLKPRKTSPR